MSRDIFVQDIPTGISHVSEIASDYEPEPLQPSYDEIVATIERLAPTADFSDPEWGIIDTPTYSIEVNIRRAVPVRSFAFHVRSAGHDADDLIARILAELQLRGFDVAAESGLFGVPEEA